MSLSSYSAVLAEFGNQIGISGLSPNEDGAATLRINGAFEFNLLVSTAGDTVTAFAELGRPGGEEDPAEIYQALLEANYFWGATGGATFSLQPGSGVVVVAQQFPVASLTPAVLEQVLQRFIEFAEKGLPGFGDEESGAESTTDPAFRV